MGKDRTVKRHQKLCNKIAPHMKHTLMTRIAAAGVVAYASFAHAFAGSTNRVAYFEKPELHDRRLEEAMHSFTCDDGVKSAAETWQITGPNLGGMFVLEPWITPSLFYQFLSESYDYVDWDDQFTNPAEHTGVDSFTFCKALGPVEGNKQMRRHWAAWHARPNERGACVLAF